MGQYPESSAGTRALRAFCAAAMLGLMGWVPGAEGGMGDGILVGDATLHPYVEGRALYDSNVFLDRDDEESDTALTGQAGLRLQREGEQLVLEAHGFVYTEDYQDADDADDEDFGVEASLVAGRPEGVELTLEPAYTQTDETDRELGTIEGRDEIRVDAGLIRQVTDKFRGRLAYGFQDSDYDRDELFDRREHRGSARALYDVTEKTAFFVEAIYGEQESDGLDGRTGYTRFHGGIDYRITDKLSLEAGAGYRDNDESDLGSFSYDAGAIWRATEKVQLAAQANNRLVPSAQDEGNFTLQNSLELTLLADITENMTCTLRGAWLSNELDRDVVSEETSSKQESDTFTTSLRVDYLAASQALDFFAELAYEERTSSLDDEYDQVLLALGVNAQY